VRAVLDVNVLVSAILSPTGAPAWLLIAWQTGAFELIVSSALLAELARTLGYSKLRRLIPAPEADAYVEWLGRSATVVNDPDGPPPVRAVDPDDDYLVALAADQRAMLVSGDRHLLALSRDFPVVAPGDFLLTIADR